MTSYHARPATIDDADALVRHRLGMFTDMGIAFDRAALADAFRRWLAETMPSGTYRAWVAESSAGTVAGGGIVVVPWPPGPTYAGSRVAYVFNVYVEPAHRRRGVARLIMDAVHAWCRTNGVTSIALNTSRDARPLYESIGYRESPQPMMFLGLDRSR